MTNGLAYNNRKSSWMGENVDFAFDWMAEQMRKRIGEPPLPEIKRPVWAWYQWESKKKRIPPLSTMDKTNDKEVMLEINVPDSEVLLSDFELWHCVLWGVGIINDRHLYKKVTSYSQDYLDLPIDIQKIVADSWERIFDLKKRDKEYASRAVRNRSIQATLWCVRKEWVISAKVY